MVSYYVSARMAYFARAIPVAGNLFHHAVEMLLKGYLCRTLDDRGRWRLKHNLRRTWRRFKDEARCYDTWRGIRDIVAGMARQDYDLELRR